MLRRIGTLSVTAAAIGLFSLSASADPLLTAGYVSLDATASGATFDIVNQTGANASTFPDTTYPIATPLTFDNVMLTIDFAGGGSVSEDPTQFLSDGSGGYTGQFNLDLAQFPLSDATLTGSFSPTDIALNDGSTSTSIAATFSAMVLPSAGSTLQIGDFALINATATPEPATFCLMGFGMLLCGAVRRGFVRAE